ncbi:MAG: DCC1-like thiol-disulfide oxidoreductase family protein [Pseudomonadota bacterium]
MEIEVLYDGECPFCARFADMVAIRRNGGDVQLVNAREVPERVRALAERGVSIDDGMVVTMGGREYFGPDAMTALAQAADDGGVFSRLNRWVFGARWRARLFYPPMVLGRKLVLRMMGRRPIVS